MRDWGWNFHQWNLGGKEVGADAARFAEASEVGGEAVGDVHHGGGDAAASEGLGQGDRNPRIKMRLEEFWRRGLAS